MGSINKGVYMLSFNFIPCKEFGHTKIIPSKKYWLFFKTKEEKIFTPSEEYIVVDGNKTCPTVIGHPHIINRLINSFIALPNVINTEVVCQNGRPVSYKILED